jgi:hypothetical protein
MWRLTIARIYIWLWIGIFIIEELVILLIFERKHRISNIT